MGWYAHGPGGAQYKYGDVFEALMFTDIGQLYYHPRLSTTGENYLNDEYIEALEFVADVQKKAKAHDLPWVDLPFVNDGLLYDFEHDDFVSTMTAHLQQHRETLKTLLALEDHIDNISQLTLSFSWQWLVDDIPSLYQWLQDECEEMTDKTLSQGQIDVWYRPPASLQAAFDALEGTDHFIASMVGAHAVSKDDVFEVYQPDDDDQHVIDL